VRRFGGAASSSRRAHRGARADSGSGGGTPAVLRWNRLAQGSTRSVSAIIVLLRTLVATRHQRSTPRSRGLAPTGARVASTVDADAMPMRPRCA